MENCVVKILIVDDRQENLFALEVVLANQNYVFVKAGSGKEALKVLLHEQDFALILMDVQMPIMNGFETAELIRETEKFKHVPIIFLTANTDRPEDIFKGYKTGAVDFMVKPLKPEILKAKVSVFVELYKKNYELKMQGEDMKLLNAQLKQQSKYVRSLIESSLDPMITINLEGQITDMNQALEKITGLKREKISGTNFVNYFTNPKIANELYRDVFEKNSIVDYLLTIKDENNKLTDVLCNASVYKDDKGNVAGAVVAIREKLLSKYSRSLIEASLDPLITISSEGKITDLNEALENVTGIPREKITGTNFFTYFTDPQKAREVYQEAFAKGFVVNFPLTIRHTSGKLTDVLFNGSTYKDDRGNILGIVIVARDVTAQNRFERELIEAKRKAEMAMRSKQQFLSNMSHEIRTPLNAIIGFTNVIMKSNLDPKQKEYLNAIKLSGDSLLALINDILDLSKVDSGKMTFEKTPFKLSNSISSMMKLFETKLAEKKLEMIKEYDPGIPEVLIGDSLRLHQVIMNLVSNAIKFTDHGKITIGVRRIEHNDEISKIEFTVTDTGIGIPKNKIESIFDNFQQATSGTTRLYGGTGLGLAIVRQLVEAQGGKVSVKSKTGKGSTFSFTLDFQNTNAIVEPNVEKSSEPMIASTNVKVLVAEDIKFNQLLMKTLLDSFGITSEMAENGKVAIDKLKTDDYDLILMDLQMPQMNGFEATDHIRKKMRSKIPIIALTADVTSADLEKCKAVGMNDYISKPIDDKILYQLITKHTVELRTAVNSDTTNTTSIDVPNAKGFKYVNFDYLRELTFGKPEGIASMIRAYLEETPRLLEAMKKGIEVQDWESTGAAAHSLIPSFSILGIDLVYEDMARKIQESSSKKEKPEYVNALIHKIEEVCNMAMLELNQELAAIQLH
jgi:PAS domain S-box-containing protein